MTTASTSRPTLVLDIGGTLLERTSSPVAETVDWLRTRGIDVPGMVDRVKAIVQTAPTAGAAEDAIASVFSLAAADRADLAARWRAPVVPGSPRAGAVELLHAAVELGWHLCAASTCVAWAPRLAADIERHLGDVVTSHELAVTKDEPSFWTTLVAKVGCDPAFTVVVGDDATADDEVPAAVGLTTWPCPADGGPDLMALHAALVAAGPMPSDAAAVCAAHAERWRDRDVLVVRSLAPFVSTVTRCQVEILTTAPRGAAASSGAIRQRLRSWSPTSQSRWRGSARLPTGARSRRRATLRGRCRPIRWYSTSSRFASGATSSRWSARRRTARLAPSGSTM